MALSQKLTGVAAQEATGIDGRVLADGREIDTYVRLDSIAPVVTGGELEMHFRFTTYASKKAYEVAPLLPQNATPLVVRKDSYIHCEEIRDPDDPKVVLSPAVVVPSLANVMSRTLTLPANPTASQAIDAFKSLGYALAKEIGLYPGATDV